MKKRILAAGVCLFVLSTMRADADVPVIDVTSVGQQIQQLATAVKEYALQVKQYVGEQLSWATQAQQYATQLQQYATEAAQLLAFVHAPSLGTAMGLLNQAGLGSSMPVSPYAVMGLLNGSAFSGGGVPNIAGIFAPLPALSGASYTANHVYTPTDNSWASQQLIAEGNAVNGTQATALAAYQQLQAHEAAIPSLRTTLQAADNPKDVADAQGEISLEGTWTANQAASLTAVQIAAEQQRLAQEQADNESIDKGIDNFLAQTDGRVP